LQGQKEWNLKYPSGRFSLWNQYSSIRRL